MTVIIDLTAIRDGTGPSRLTGAALLTVKPTIHLDELFANEDHLPVEATWGIYPTEAINGRLEHLRGSALGFRKSDQLHRWIAAGDRRVQTATTPSTGMSRHSPYARRLVPECHGSRLYPYPRPKPAEYRSKW